MKFIIDNYSNNSSSQALYIHKHINETPDCKCWLNNNELPMFDLLDGILPDVYITQVNVLSRDLIHYIKQNQSNIKLMINIDNTKLGTILDIEEALLEQKIEFRFFGNTSGVKKPISKKTNIFNLLDSFDMNLNQNKSTWKKKIDCLIVTSYDVDISNLELSKLTNKTFHVCSFKDAGEINTSVLDADKNLYHNYETIVYANLEYGINQSFFDALHNKCKVFFASKMYDKEIQKTLSKLLKVDQSLNFNHDNILDNFDPVFQQVETYHNSARRVKSLLSQISK